jgi:Domain of unknown function (DUF4124)
MKRSMKISEKLNAPRILVQKYRVVEIMLCMLFSTTTIVQVAQAAVYKKIDADGHVTFSDVPDKSFKLINVAPLTTIPALSQDKIAAALKEPDASKSNPIVNYSMNIISPAADQSYHRSIDAFSPNVVVKPDLKNGDQLVFLVDGKPFEKDLPAIQFDRGQHAFEARIVSEKGRVLKSKSVIFFVLQPHR